MQDRWGYVAEFACARSFGYLVGNDQVRDRAVV